jgi:ketosteroid isomerase-like protein
MDAESGRDDHRDREGGEREPLGHRVREDWAAIAQNNVEVMRNGIGAWNCNDRDAWLAVFAPEAEWHTAGRFADRGGLPRT